MSDSMTAGPGGCAMLHDCHKAAGQGGRPAGHPGDRGHFSGHPGGHADRHPGSSRRGMGPRVLEDGTPACRLIAWEVTRSCNLACRHCRAEAHMEPYPGELDHDEAIALIDTFPEVGRPIIIFTGGDPMMRPDVYELVRYAHDKGLPCAFSPNGTLITRETAHLIREAGVNRCSISIDAADAASHDGFRGVPGAFDASVRGMRYLTEAGVPFQINTTVTRNNLSSFKKIFELCESLGAEAWHIFLLVPTGRASELGDQVISAEEYEEVLRWFYQFRKTTRMHLKATCAPHYYRIMRQMAREEGVPVDVANFGMDAHTRGCLGGTGFCFISHVGQVQPCGYLELNCGNVRETRFSEIWRTSSYFRQFRDQKCYEGKCGVCEYHKVCGGCRARAYNMNGNHMGEEPLCSYIPLKMRQRQAARGGSMAELDATDRALLDIIQTDFPLVPRPYAEIGERLGISETEALERVRALKKSRIIRRMGANFQSRKLGWVSTLCAARVSVESLDKFVELVNAEPGVTHNYEREHAYNIWFTFIGPSMQYIQERLDTITARTGVPILNLPATRLFKIKVNFKLSDED